MGGDEQLLKWDPECTPPMADTETGCVCALTKGSFVLSEIPSPKEGQFYGEDTECFLCTRLSLLRTFCGEAGRTGRWNQCRQCPEEKHLAFATLERMQCWTLKSPSVTVSTPAPGSSASHFPVMHSWDVFSRSASCYPTLSGFLGHQLNMQSGDSLYWFQFWVFDPWKGNLSDSKSSQEKAILQSTESHSHTHLICFPYISSKSSYKTRICHYLTFCSTWEIYFRYYYT